MAGKRTVEQVLDRVGKSGNSLLSLLSGLFAAFLMLYSGYVLYDMFYTQNAASGWDLLQYRPEIIEDAGIPLGDMDKMATLNPDYRAWLTLYDTGVDHPVLQGTDDLYYASHDIYKKSSLTGSIYLAADNSPDFSDTYNLIYGHRMDNGLMFGPLEEYSKAEFFREHQEGILVTKDAVYDLTVFAMLETNAYDDMIYVVDGKDSSNLLPYVWEHAVQFDEAAAADMDKILAMSTCASARTDGRQVVFAKMTPRGTVTPTVEPTVEPTIEPTVSPTGGPTPVPTDAVVPTDGPSIPQVRPTDNPETPIRTGSNGTPVPVVPGGNPDPTTTTETEVTGSPVSTSSVSTSSVSASSSVSDSEAGKEQTALPAVDDDGDTVEIEDQESPLAAFVNGFHPTGGSYGYRAWALVNLICLILTIYLFLPLLHLRAKFRRGTYMHDVNGAMKELYDAEELTDEEIDEYGYILYEAQKLADERCEEMSGEIFSDTVEKLYYDEDTFKDRFRIGLLSELIISVIALIAFIRTEDMRLPMVLTDRWTLLMLLFLIGCWIVDWRLVRYREKTGPAEKTEKEKAEENAG